MIQTSRIPLYVLSTKKQNRDTTVNITMSWCRCKIIQVVICTSSQDYVRVYLMMQETSSIQVFTSRYTRSWCFGPYLGAGRSDSGGFHCGAHVFHSRSFLKKIKMLGKIGCKRRNFIKMFEHRSEYRKSEYTRGMRDTA